MSHRDLVTLHLAEEHCPWGEAAANARARYLALRETALHAADEGVRREAAAAADEIMDRLSR